MPEWFDSNDLLNGLVAETIAMAVEILVIIKVLEWRRRREDARRFRAYRTSTRRLLRRRVEQLLDQLTHGIAFVRAGVTEYIRAGSDAVLPVPAQPNPFIEISDTLYRLTHDFADRHAVLDEATLEIMVALQQTVELLLQEWAVQRLTDPRLPAYWPEVIQASYLASLERLEGKLPLIKQRITSIEASLAFAEHHDDRRGDTELQEEAERITSFVVQHRAA